MKQRERSFFCWKARIRVVCVTHTHTSATMPRACLLVSLLLLLFDIETLMMMTMIRFGNADTYADGTWLASLYNATNGSGWKNDCNKGWNVADPSSVCTSSVVVSGGNTVSPWNGVTCNTAGTSVTSVSLSDCNFGGNRTLPDVTGNDTMQSLVTLSLYSNRIKGSLPDSWGAGFSSLQVLDLHDNEISGPLPSNWSRLTSLTSLQLRSNNIQSTLPDAWSSLKSLLTLSLGSNEITSPTLPSSWGNLSSLTVLSLSNNQLSGSIPESWWQNLLVLQTLQLDHNKLSGTLPANISRLGASLRTLMLNSNTFTGSLPDAWFNLSKLLILQLDNNRISGSLPSNWSNLVTSTTLQTLSLDNNSLSGTLWPASSSSSPLQSLTLSNNSLTGSIPSSLLSLPKLIKIWLSNNYFNGSLNMSGISRIADSSSLLGVGSCTFAMNCFVYAPVNVSGTNFSNCTMAPQRDAAACGGGYAKAKTISPSPTATVLSSKSRTASLSNTVSFFIASSSWSTTHTPISAMFSSTPSSSSRRSISSSSSSSPIARRVSSSPTSQTRSLPHHNHRIATTRTNTALSSSTASSTKDDDSLYSSSTLALATTSASVSAAAMAARSVTLTVVAPRSETRGTPSRSVTTHAMEFPFSVSPSWSHLVDHTATERGGLTVSFSSSTSLVQGPSPPPPSAINGPALTSVTQGAGVGGVVMGVTAAPFSAASVTSLMMLQTSLGALSATKRCNVVNVRRSSTSAVTSAEEDDASAAIGSSMVSNPLRIKITLVKDAALQYAAGSVVGNAVLILCAGVIIESGMLWWTNRENCLCRTSWFARRVLRLLPGRGTAAFSSLLLPSVMSTVGLFRGTYGLSIGFGVLGFMVYMLLPTMFMLLVLWHTYFLEGGRVDDAEKPSKTSPHDDDLLAEAEHWSLQRFRCFLNGYSLRYRWYCVVDFATAVLCGILAALPEDSSSPACKWAIWATLGVLATATLSAAVLRPREEILDNAFSILNRSLSTAVVTLCAVGQTDAASVVTGVLSVVCLIPPVLSMMKHFPLDRLRGLRPLLRRSSNHREGSHCGRGSDSSSSSGVSGGGTSLESALLNESWSHHHDSRAACIVLKERSEYLHDEETAGYSPGTTLGGEKDETTGLLDDDDDDSSSSSIEMTSNPRLRQAHVADDATRCDKSPDDCETLFAPLPLLSPVVQDEHHHLSVTEHQEEERRRLQLQQEQKRSYFGVENYFLESCGGSGGGPRGVIGNTTQ